MNFHEACGSDPIASIHFEPAALARCAVDRDRCCAIPTITLVAVGLNRCQRSFRIPADLGFDTPACLLRRKHRDNGCCKSSCPATDDVGIRFAFIYSQLQSDQRDRRCEVLVPRAAELLLHRRRTRADAAPLGAVQRLDLVRMLSRTNGVRILTLVDTEHQRAVRQRQEQPDDVADQDYAAGRALRSSATSRTASWSCRNGGRSSAERRAMKPAR